MMTIYTNARLPPHRTEMRRAPYSMIKPSSSRRTNFHCNGRFCQKLFLVFSIGLFVFLVTTMQMDNYDIQKPVELEIAESKRGNSPVAEQTSGGKSTHQKKKILAWTKIFGKDFLIYDKRKALTSDHAFSQCPVHKNCEWTIERSALEQVDAVVFHIFPKDFSLQDLPAYRNPAQNWVFLNLEPPQRFQDGMMANLDGMFNVTATYEDDADLSLPYGYYYKREKPLANFLPQNTNRTKPIVWMVSRCHTLSRREIYADDLKQYIDIDIYGACGKPAPRKGVPPINLDFRKELAKQYYFYLAFENTDCQDYITEKFWSALLAGLVPIVRGKFPRYEKHVPPGSFINADSFFSYADLAEYLKYLMQTPEAYNKFFEWRRDYHAATVATYINLDVHCKLCAYLHEHQDRQKVYNMSERYSKRERCYDFHSNLPQISHEQVKAYDDEFKGFLPLKT